MAPLPPDFRQALACVATGLALPAAALGLGELRVDSALGEPLDATVALEAAGAQRPQAGCFSLARTPPGEIPALPRTSIAVEPDGPGWRLRLRTRAPVWEPASRVRIDAACEGSAAASRSYDVLLDPRAPVAAPPLKTIPGDTLAVLATAIYPRSRRVREAYVEAIRAANPAVQSLGADEPLPAGTPLVLPDLKRFSLGLAAAAPQERSEAPSPAAPGPAAPRPPSAKPEPRAARGSPPPKERPAPPRAAQAGPPATMPSPRKEGTPPGSFVLRLSAPEVDLSRSRGIDDGQRTRLRERLLVLDADDQVAALLAMRHSLRQLEGRVSELQLKLSALPPQAPAARAPEPPKPAASPQAPEPAKAAEAPAAGQPATSAAPPKAAPQPAAAPAPVAGDDGVPPWLWAILAAALAGIAAIAWRLLGRPRARPAPAAAPRPDADLDAAEAMMAGGAHAAQPPPPADHRVVASTDESLSTTVGGGDPAALRRRYIEERFPEIAGGTISPGDPDSVVKAARLFYEDGSLARAVELLQFAVEEDPAELKTWLALFEIFRLEGLAGEFAGLAERFKEHHGSGDYWRKVQFIGREIDPSNALYREAPADHLGTIGPAASRRAMPVTFDPLAENWLNAPMDFTTDALAGSLRAGLLADAGLQETDLVADPLPALKSVEIFTVA